ncbi:MAG: helix-turn-helix domain-containing protein, partial [Propionibacteriaceae bacterium]|jgi:excisionase family DNA binding protein|nr:helix-turn-helix domain-containing protein [Propionibacteriaceae bacterium]
MTEAEFELWAGGGDFLTVAQAADRLGVTRQSVLARIKRRTLPARRRGHRWLIPSSAVAEGAVAGA